MFDVVLKGGTIMDGTGARSRVGDVGIQDGRIAAIDTASGEARATLDITGMVVAPGFVDIHTHYDAQAFWDPTLSPSPLHGVTTVMGGNCGFSIAPLDPEDADYLMRMLARVEGMSVESLAVGVPWDWRTTAEFLDRLDGTLVPNAGFLVGHSALRRMVMHDEACRRAATDNEVEAMKALLRDGLSAGGMGFSSTHSLSHSDHLGKPVPSRYATGEELVALCSVVGEFPGTTLEFIAPRRPMSDEAVELMAAMSAAANRPLNWNLLAVYDDNSEFVAQDLRASDRAAGLGGRLVALTLPGGLNMRINFESGVLLDTLPGWGPFMAASHDEKLAFLRDPDRSAWLEEQAKGRLESQAWIEKWSGYTISETYAEALAHYNGKSIGEIARASGQTPWQALIGIVVEDDLRTAISTPSRGDGTDLWRRRLEAWRDTRTVVGGSDAGAHLDAMDTFSFATTLLASAVRERDLLPMEEAISMVTDGPARLYGLRHRGRINEGWIADLVVFDPATIGPGPVRTRFDLPANGPRLYGEGIGIKHLFVNGIEVVRHGEFTGARPGRIIRSGHDTDTVTAR